MKKTRAYRSYRATENIDWLDKLPSHWEEHRLKSTVMDVIAGVWGDEPDGENDRICIRVADFDRVRLCVKEREDYTLRSVPENKYRSCMLTRGDLLLEKSGGGDLQPVGAVIQYDLPEEAVSSNFVARVRTNTYMVRPRFMLYMHNALYQGRITTRSIKQTTGIQNLDVSTYLDERIPIPPLEEQVAVEHFLEESLTYIDSLIADKERLIALLQEQRQTIITEAVTKGLDPTVPMKGSGVEWVGQVPEHWETVLLKRVAHLKSGEGITSREIQDAGEYPVYGGNGLRGFTSNYTHSGHHALIGRQGALCGNIHVVDEKFWASEHAVVVTTAESVDWLGFVLETMNLNQYSESAAQPGISVERVKNLPIPLPPHKEQLSIADYLKKFVRETRELIELTSRAVVQLSDYRQSLITEAVTGKIDVRGEVVS